MFGTRFFKRNKPMAEPKNPEENVNAAPEDSGTPPVAEGKLAVVVDQDGLFLRVEKDGVELEQDEQFELFEEQVEKEDEGAPSDNAQENGEGEKENEGGADSDGDKSEEPEVQEAAPAVAGDKCPECGGRGLKSDTEECKPCNGSGRVV
jgi:hypothetical protein